MSSPSTDTAFDACYYPRFDHGEDLAVIVGLEGFFRFQAEDLSYVDADNVVYLDDWV